MTVRGRRPRWLTAEAQQCLLDAVEAGNTVTTAAAAAGIDPAELYRWASSAAAEDRVFAGFTAELRTARAKAEATLVEAMTTDARGGFLVRKYTKLYPNGDEETDESFAPPNGRIALEWLRARNGHQWGKPDQPSDMLGEDAMGAVPGGVAQEAGTIDALAGRLHAMIAGREDEVLEDHPGAVTGVVLPADPEAGG